MHSISEGKGNMYQGIVVGTKRLNSLSGSVNILTRVAGEELIFKLKLYSPLLASFEID